METPQLVGHRIGPGSASYPFGALGIETNIFRRRPNCSQYAPELDEALSPPRVVFNPSRDITILTWLTCNLARSFGSELIDVILFKSKNK
jgi:hypothetical protein